MHQNLESKYLVFNLVDLIENEDIGEDKVKAILSSFSCKNKEVETFLRKRAILFAQKEIATTFLVFEETETNMILLGYFSLANKQFVVDTSHMSRNLKDSIKQHVALGGNGPVFNIPAPLIAQLGKNYTDNVNTRISGDDLMFLALGKIEEVQRILAGKVCFVECENIPALLKFYDRHGFKEFGRRQMDAEEKAMATGDVYIQMLRYRKKAKKVPVKAKR